MNPPLEGEAEFANCTLGGKHLAIVIGENLLWDLIGGKAASLEISGGDEYMSKIDDCWRMDRSYGHDRLD